MKPRNIILFLAGYSVLLTPYASAFQPPVQAPGRNVVVAPDPDYSPQGGFFGTISLSPIVRYQDLPMRMHLDPLIPEPVALQVLDSRLVPLWERMLREGTDAELVEVAVQSLARVAEMKLADIQPAEKSLQALAQNSENQRLRYAAGAALAIGDLQSSAPLLIKLAETGNDAQRLRIEPSLIRWKTAAGQELWKARLLDASTTIISFQLATEGLASVNHGESVEVLLSITADSGGTYPKRMAAARAAAILSSDRAFSAAEPLSRSNVQDRMLALALLNTEKPEALVKAATLCADSSDGVASVAWQQVFVGNSELLQNHLEIGRKHRDAQVRMTAAKTMRLWPNPDRAKWLQELLSDIHIEVRNVARTMLVLVSAEHPELKEQIVAQAAALLKPESADWQGVEQSLLVLAQLQATQFSATAFALLGHARDEVVVTAAWLIQLFPDDAIRSQVQNEIEQCEAKLSRREASTNDISLREMMLLQYAGLVRLKELEPIMEQQFSKSVQGSPEKRASALWALAVIHEKTANEELAKKYDERIQDRNSMPPEAMPVRRSSVMALGLLRCRNSVPVLMEAYTIDPQDTRIPDTVRWIFPLLGQPMLPEIATAENGVGGWRITPVD